VSVVCRQVEVSGTNLSRVQSPTECGVSECDREASTVKTPWPNKGCCTTEDKLHFVADKMCVVVFYSLHSPTCFFLNKRSSGRPNHKGKQGTR
jgi:hypothetical protein